MKVVRHGTTIFCDDIRFEIGNKLTYVGIYYGDLQVPSFPIALPKLCIAVRLVTPTEIPFSMVRIVIMKNDEVLMEEAVSGADTPEVHMSDKDANLISRVNNIFAHFTVSPLVLSEPCWIRVRAYDVDGEEIRLGAVRIGLAPATPAG
jgi:hypothetical protein